MTIHVDLKSFWHGIRAMKRKHEKVNYGIEYRPSHNKPIAFWICLWTPNWHKGRGPYISIGLGFIAFYRGY